MVLSNLDLNNIRCEVIKKRTYFQRVYWITFFMLSCFSTLFSQDLYVDDNSYLYARDVVLFVNDDIRLETATSNLYLRGDAQLLQNTDTKNSDIGELSVYQNQTTGIYEYNFWCAPVGVGVDGTAQANVDFDGSNIHDPADHTDLTNVNSSAYAYTAASNGTATELSSIWMYRLISAGGYNGWRQISNTGNLASGYGFTLKGSPNANNVLDFRGRPNNGDILIDCTFNGTDQDPNSGLTDQVETLTGNPYPSAMDLKLFLINATNQTVLNGEIFFWEQRVNNSHYLVDYEGGYGVYTPGDPLNLADNGSYANAPFVDYTSYGATNGTTTGNTADYSANNARRYAAIGQGFIVSSFDNGGLAAGGNAVINNSMRLYLAEDSTTGGNGSIFAKGGNQKNKSKEVIAMSHNGVDYQSFINNPALIPEVKIHTRIDDTFYKENLIAFRENTPDNTTYNRFFDASNLESALANDAYMQVENKALSIKSIKFDDTTRIPFVLKTDRPNVSFEISAYELRHVSDDVSIYLYDGLNDSYTDIKNGSFNVVMEAQGIHEDRFEITFSNQNNTLSDNDHEFSEMEIFQNNGNAQIEIFNPSAIKINSISIYDISGKNVWSQDLHANPKLKHISTKGMSTGTYVISIILDNSRVINKKVVISN